MPNPTPYVKDGIHAAIIHAAPETTNPANEGTKVAAHCLLTVAPGATQSVVLRLSDTQQADPLGGVAGVLATRRSEADEFYASLPGAAIPP